MTIPISSIAPWIAIGFFSIVLGGLCHIGTSYPRDPSVRGWSLWIAFFSTLLTITYATLREWIHWA